MKFLYLHLDEFNQRGQALIVVVLIIVVTLTVGLSVALRTTTNLRISSENESSERAFSAAEAGIEQALVTGSSISETSLANNTTYETSVSNLSGGSFNLNNGSQVLKDEPVDLWLSIYPSYASSWSGNMTINWGDASDTCSPVESGNSQAALEVTVISGTVGNPTVSSYHLDPCASRSSNNNFEYVSTPGATIDGRAYARSKTIPVSSGLIARIIPLYAGTFVGVQKGALDSDFPSQGTIITSTGTSDSATRKIVSFRAHPKLPTELFPFVFFSPK